MNCMGHIYTYRYCRLELARLPSSHLNYTCSIYVCYNLFSSHKQAILLLTVTSLLTSHFTSRTCVPAPTFSQHCCKAEWLDVRLPLHRHTHTRTHTHTHTHTATVCLHTCPTQRITYTAHCMLLRKTDAALANTDMYRVP